MKIFLIFFLLSCCVIGYEVAIHTNPCDCKAQHTTKEAEFVIEMVANDSFLQNYILVPETRIRTREALSQFEKKELTRKNKTR